ncbi:MAG: AraC family transcriptional regulator [Ruminococcus sp.]|jgi:YesN/AraC family two-component response regulator
MKSKLTTNVQFITMHYVDQHYHSHHSQLIHCHDELELFYVMNGAGHYIVDGRKWAIHDGNLIICNAGILHGEEPFSSNDMESYCCVLKNIDEQELGMSVENFRLLSANPVLNFSDTDERKAFEHLLLALNELKNTSRKSQQICSQIACCLLKLVSEKLSERHRQDHLLHSKVDDFINSVIKYLENHYRESLTLAELGKKFHISHYYLSHIFKEQTGYSPIKYAAQLKIGEAQNLLMNTGRSIGSISEYLGFNDSCHFNVMFKKYTNLSPSEYRQHFQKKKQEST